MKEKVYSIGIDVSKNTLDICFLWNNHSVLKEFRINNSEKWIKKLIEKIWKFDLDKDAAFLLESTWSYHLFASLSLKDAWFKVKIFNPIIWVKYAKWTIRKCKTDKIDAKRIAEIWIFEDIPEFNTWKETIMLKRRVSILQTLTNKRQALKASVNQLKEDYNKLWIKINIDVINPILQALKGLDNAIKSLEKDIQKEGKLLKWFDLIKDIKWISAKSASIILSFISDKEFTSREAITAFAWLDISIKQNWTSVNWKWRISKRWNSMLRKTLTQCAWWLRMHNEKFQELVRYYEWKGRHYFEIMTILAKKLLHIIYWILKTNSHFNSAKIWIPVN